MGVVHKVGKFYQKVMMKNIVLFISAGLLMVVFGENGWFPNHELNAIALLVYEIILPVMIAYHCGAKLSDFVGGTTAVIAVTGLLAADSHAGFFGAMVIGPLTGFLWKKLQAIFLEKSDFRMKMLMKNLLAAITGGILSIALYLFLAPVLENCMDGIRLGIQFLIERRLLVALSIIVEPAKVFFLNNLMNHAVFVPLGMEQLQSAGSSIFFLMETNPGPGLGVLLALFLLKKAERNEAVSAMFAHGIGGIHEVYFPFALSDMRLLLPLILGGMAGNIYFSLTGAGLQGPVSPGSVFIILLMAGKNKVFHVLLGMLLSAAVSCGVSICLLKIKSEKAHATETEAERIEKEKAKQQEMKREKIERIAIVCDGGVGSSVMGAALLRRNLAGRKIEGIKVEAFAADLVPEDVKVLICQKDYYQLLPEELRNREIFTVDNLVQMDGFSVIIEEIQKRNS